MNDATLIKILGDDYLESGIHEGKGFTLDITLTSRVKMAVILYVVAEDGLITSVPGGENADDDDRRFIPWSSILFLDVVF